MTPWLARISVLFVVAAGALVLVPSALSATEAPATAPGESCSGPCPVVIFGLGDASGELEAYPVNGDTVRCFLSPGGTCDFAIDDYPTVTNPYIKPVSGPFKGWDPSSGVCVRFEGSTCVPAQGSGGAACAYFSSATPATTTCPPPYIQIYKKGDGTGTVTGTPEVGQVETCAATQRVFCDFSRWTPNQMITLHATPAEGAFLRWESKSGDLCTNATSPTCQVPLTSARIVCAVFVRVVAPPDQICPGTTPNPPPPPPVVPNTKLTSGPSGTRATRSRRATFRFASTLRGSRFVCRLDSKPWLPCRSPKTYTRLKPGVHTFRVRAIASNGRLDPTPAARRWRIRR